ncbi:hypothetical protein MKZ38_005057 [Zalerion maritima]|uniref:Uncharacterized protein n=1 Tax=Zalerion maritima TaxID=339359 RepID=A0AAD5RLS8_9PEZI|nr:hypothetical protein MKZ38_005057 [Zalerion maritima]
MNEASKVSQPEAVDERPEPVSTTTPARKRQIDDSDLEPQPKRARLTREKLTRKNLATFNKMGKKKDSDPTDDSKSTRTTSTTTSGFAVKARKNGILDPFDSKPPKNLEDIRKQYAKSRATASPPESVYEYYASRVEGAGTEATMVFEVGGKLLKEYDDKGYKREFNRAFTNFPKNAGFNDGLSAPRPDFVEGLEMKGYLPFPVDTHVPGATLYKDDPRSITLPHVAGEWKGPTGDIREARMQSAYDGAALVHGRTQALAYMGKEDPPGHAAITTFTTDGTNLNLYAHYAAPLEENKDILEYHQYPISSTNIKDTYQGYKEGRKSLRNLQGHAKDRSYDLKSQLKEHWKHSRNKPPPVEGVYPPDVEPPPHIIDGYEDASPHVQREEAEDEEDDYEIVQPTTHRESSRHSKSSHYHHSSQHSSKSHHSSKSSHHPSPRSSKSHHSSSETSHKESSRHAPSSESHKRKASQTSSHGSSHSSSRYESKRKGY